MAKRKTPDSAGAGQPPPDADTGATTPVPPDTLSTTTKILKAGTLVHRVHKEQYQADQFNPGRQGNARFSPIENDKGQAIPTLYGGTTADCAMMETIFHDVPHTPGLKTVDKGKLAGQVLSKVELTQDLQLVDLANVPLRKLGVSRKQLIDTEKDQYPATRKWAEALHQKCPQAQGLSWISRQDDTARAVVLFGDRIPVEALLSQGDSRSLVGDPDTYDDVLDLAARLGVLIVPGKD